MNKIIGATLLIAGCCIGAGMLGLPVMAGPSGFFPSSCLFILAWAFMVLCGLVMAELVLSFDQPQINLLTMVEKTLGKLGKTFASILFALLFYAIMIAYVIASAVLVSDFVEILFGIRLPFWVASSLFVLLMYLVIAKGIRHVDGVNRALMFGLVLCYGLLIYFGLPAVEHSRLERQDWSLALFTLPILVISFGFHNLVPTLSTYLERKESALKWAIGIGSFLPLVVYLLWEYVILGIVPYISLAEWNQAQGGGEIVTQVLAETVGSPLIADLARGFAFFAIATSFLPVSFSFLDFLHDGFKRKGIEMSRPLLAAIVLLPPLFGALGDPHLFLQALNYAGGFCAVLLFGMLPALMAWKRLGDKQVANRFHIAKKPVLFFILIGSLFVMCVELFHELRGVL